MASAPNPTQRPLRGNHALVDSDVGAVGASVAPQSPRPRATSLVDAPADSALFNEAASGIIATPPTDRRGSLPAPPPLGRANPDDIRYGQMVVQLGDAQAENQRLKDRISELSSQVESAESNKQAIKQELAALKRKHESEVQSLNDKLRNPKGSNHSKSTGKKKGKKKGQAPCNTLQDAQQIKVLKKKIATLTSELQARNAIRGDAANRRARTLREAEDERDAAIAAKNRLLPKFLIFYIISLVVLAILLQYRCNQLCNLKKS